MWTGMRIGAPLNRRSRRVIAWPDPRTSISLQSTRGRQDDASFGDFIEDKAAESPLDMTRLQPCSKGKLGDVLWQPERTRAEVLELRFGLGDGNARTLEEVGQQFRVTRGGASGRSRPRQLRKNAPSTRLRHLQGFLRLKGWRWNRTSGRSPVTRSSSVHIFRSAPAERISISWPESLMKENGVPHASTISPFSFTRKSGFRRDEG